MNGSYFIKQLGQLFFIRQIDYEGSFVLFLYVWVAVIILVGNFWLYVWERITTWLCKGLGL